MNLNSTPASSTALSSSVYTDEETDQRVSIFLGIVEKAATLLYESTALSSTRQPRSGNIERNRLAANEQLLREKPDLYSGHV